MMRTRTLAEIRAELEAALGDTMSASQPPEDLTTTPGRRMVWQSLQRFLTKESTKAGGTDSSRTPAAADRPSSASRTKPRRRKPTEG